MDSTPDVKVLEWMTGNWSCSIWGGTFEERWSPAEAGTKQGMCRLIRDGKTAHQEFMAVELKAEEGWILWILPSRISKPDLKAKAFKLVAMSDKESRWECATNDFPRTIHYRRVDQNHMKCELLGEQAGKPATAQFEFKRVKS